jgi:hypothetical protein
MNKLKEAKASKNEAKVSLGRKQSGRNLGTVEDAVRFITWGSFRIARRRTSKKRKALEVSKVKRLPERLNNT